MKSIILQRLLGQGNSTGQHQMMHHMSCYGANTPFCTFCIVDRGFCCVPPCHRYDVWRDAFPLSQSSFCLASAWQRWRRSSSRWLGSSMAFLQPLPRGFTRLCAAVFYRFLAAMVRPPPPELGGRWSIGPDLGWFPWKMAHPEPAGNQKRRGLLWQLAGTPWHKAHPSRIVKKNPGAETCADGERWWFSPAFFICHMVYILYQCYPFT